MTINWNLAQFVRSAAKPADFPRDGLPQVVFAGRSNVGKSSVINRILNRKNFARVGSAPGKTTHINYFSVDQKLYLVDLPGYGYAKVSKQERDRWGRMIVAWFSDSDLMALVILVVEALIKPTADDCMMAQVFLSSGKPFLVAANKLDKLKKSEINGNQQLIRETLALSDSIPLILFSAERGEGKEELLGKIKHYLEV